MNGSCVFSDPPNSSFIYVGVWERERQLIDLAIANDRLLDRRLLTRHGIDAETWRRHLRGGCWERAAPGVWRHRATEETWRLRVCAAMRWLGKEAALHGPTALAWWDLPGRRDDQVHVVLARTRRNVEGPVVVHTVEQLVPADLRRHQGIRLQKPEVAIVAAAAAGWPVSMLEETIDEAIRRRLISTGSLSRAAEGVRGSGHGGVRMLRSLLLDSGGESYLERKFLELVRRARLPRPKCQVVHRADGVHIARVDFLFESSGVVVEVTGRLGHTSDRERQRDARRRNALQAAGRIVIEFTTADVLDGRAYVVSTLEGWLRPSLALG